MPHKKAGSSRFHNEPALKFIPRLTDYFRYPEECDMVELLLPIVS